LSINPNEEWAPQKQFGDLPVAEVFVVAFSSGVDCDSRQKNAQNKKLELVR
jgi:hypothetical protein